MKILKNGSEYVTSNKLAIEQLLKHGGVEVKEPAKTITKKPPVKKEPAKEPLNKPATKKK